MQTKNLNEIANCLQIYYNLNSLPEIIQQTANFTLKKCMTLWKECLLKEYDKNDILNMFFQEIKKVMNE